MTVKILKLETTNIEFQEGMDSVFCVLFCFEKFTAAAPAPGNLPGTE